MRFVWRSDLSECIVKNQNHEVLLQMSQKLVEELIAEGIYCDTDVSHLTGNFVKVAERRACAPSVAKGETELESFSDS